MLYSTEDFYSWKVYDKIFLPWTESFQGTALVFLRPHVAKLSLAATFFSIKFKTGQSNFWSNHLKIANPKHIFYTVLMIYMILTMVALATFGVPVASQLRVTARPSVASVSLLELSSIMFGGTADFQIFHLYQYLYNWYCRWCFTIFLWSSKELRVFKLILILPTTLREPDIEMGLSVFNWKFKSWTTVMNCKLKKSET